MSDLFPHNSDPNIVNQPQIEYRVAKYPFYVRHRWIDPQTGEHKFWDSAHCPVCFWNTKYGLWDTLIGDGQNKDLFCRRCGQAVKWDE